MGRTHLSSHQVHTKAPQLIGCVVIISLMVSNRQVYGGICVRVFKHGDEQVRLFNLKMVLQDGRGEESDVIQKVLTPQ